MIFPVTTLRCAMRGVGEALDVLRDPAQTAERMVDGGRMLTRAELYETLAYLPGERWSFPGSNNNKTSAVGGAAPAPAAAAAAAAASPSSESEGCGVQSSNLPS